MGPIWDAELRVWDAKNFGLVSPGTHRNKFVKKSLQLVCKGWQCADYTHHCFCRCMKIVVAMVTETGKLLQKHMDPEITQKLFKLA